MIRIAFEEMQNVLTQLFLKYKFTEEKASLLAKVHSESTLHGVNSHGINRVGLFLEYLEQELVDINAEAKKVESFGSIERWDGHFGSGVLNATKCINRAIEMAKENGMGLVALRNTNHWMRGGTYGKMAADEGCISILFTNTISNMPPWGAKESRIGNNPFIVSIPREEGHIILDMAVSQFSFGKINNYKLAGKKLPYIGGWDNDDNLTNDPEKILDSKRALPVGYWKGSALSIVLDMLATLLSAGNSTYRISQKKYETGVSQVYLCIYPDVFQDKNLQENLINEIINYTHDVETINGDDATYYPGERSAATAILNKKEGIPVDETVWQKIMDKLKE